MTITSQDLPDILAAHRKWLSGEDGGDRADLRDADLRGADLSGADLRGADLRDADLRRADLSGANLRGADLRDADLRRAYLSGANLRGANLRGADLSGAYLSGANLRGADLRDANLRDANLRRAYLSGANLRGANLRDADLRRAYLSDADLSGADLRDFQIPQEGTLVVWKALSNGVVAKGLIPSFARRTACLINRKCRAEAWRTLAFYDASGAPVSEESVRGQHDSETVYRIGKITYPDKYDGDQRVDCSHGIHFFLTVEEARAWL